MYNVLLRVWRSVTKPSNRSISLARQGGRGGAGSDARDLLPPATGARPSPQRSASVLRRPRSPQSSSELSSARLRQLSFAWKVSLLRQRRRWSGYKGKKERSRTNKTLVWFVLAVCRREEAVLTVSGVISTILEEEELTDRSGRYDLEWRRRGSTLVADGASSVDSTSKSRCLVCLLFTMDPAEIARRSVARVSFKWKNSESLNKETADEEIDMVTTGVIVSVKNGECFIIIDPSFYLKKDMRRFSFRVHLPENDGEYGETITVTSNQLIDCGNFYGFAVRKNSYIAPVVFETSPTAQSDFLFAYLFPRESVISTAYGPGRVVASSQSENDMEVVFHDCALHEYGHLGSPIFNHIGLAVGICYATQGRTHAWTASFLKRQFDRLLKDWSIKYVCSNKDPRQEGGSSSSAPLHRAPALPSGVVTLAYNMSASVTVTYSPGVIIMCEEGKDNDHTTYVISAHNALHDTIDVFFEPNKKVQAEFCSAYSHFMLVSIKDKEFHKPVTWSSSSRPLPGYEFVESISIMAGTKLNAKAVAPMKSPVGILAFYAGQITTPRCNAGTSSSCTIVSGTENYFQLSCSFEENFVTFSNVDLEKTSYECGSVISTPVFNLKGELVGIVASSGNWPDKKTGLYSDWLLSIVERLMTLVYEGWSKEKLTWSATQAV